MLILYLILRFGGKMNITVIMPAFNEAENLKIIIPRLKDVLSGAGCDYRILVVDALLSSDETEKICSVTGSQYIRQTAKGYGDAFRTGIKEETGEYLLVFDADGSQDLSALPGMLSCTADGADVVIGSRYTRGGKTEDPLTNIIMSRVLNFSYRLILGLDAKDISTDYRIYKLEKLKSIKTTADNFGVIEETLFLLQERYKDLVVKEVPIHYKKRLAGESKRQTLKFIKEYLSLLGRLSGERRKGNR